MLVLSILLLPTIVNYILFRYNIIFC